ncbi:MAG: ABC transporter permease subunit [Anaerolineales bacterium]|nr:ABC transporter permease subunit [Anaerolineales bacterium]
MKITRPSGRAVTTSFMKWEFMRALFSFPNYIAIFLSLFIAWLLLNGTVNSVIENGLLISTNPFLIPFLAILIPYAVFLALVVAISLAREIENRTLEVLFFAPIQFPSFVLGRFLGQMTYFIVALLFVSIFFIGYALSADMKIPTGLLGAIAISPFTVASVVGFGILIASLIRRARLTIVVLLSIILVLLAIHFGQAILPSLQLDETSNALSVLGDFVKILYRLVEWISPFAYLAKGIEASQIGELHLYLMVFVGALVYTAVTLALAIWVLHKRGFSR